MGFDLGGLASFGSDLFSAYGQHRENAMNRDFQDYQASRQMDFQERMANTQHQREVSDLRAAGINPILTATGGHGNAAPSGAAGGGSAASVPVGVGQRAAASALAQQQVQVAKEQGDAVHYQAEKNKWDAEQSSLEYLIKESAAGALKEALRSSAKAEAAHNQQVEKVWRSPSSEVLKYLQLLAPVTGTASSIFNSVK